MPTSRTALIPPHPCPRSCSGLLPPKVYSRVSSTLAAFDFSAVRRGYATVIAPCAGVIRTAWPQPSPRQDGPATRHTHHVATQSTHLRAPGLVDLPTEVLLPREQLDDPDTLVFRRHCIQTYTMAGLVSARRECEPIPGGDCDVSSPWCERGLEAVGSFFRRFRRGRRYCMWAAVYPWSRAGDVYRSAQGLPQELGLGERREKE